MNEVKDDMKYMNEIMKRHIEEGLKMEKVYGMKLGKRVNSVENPKNLDIVHYLFDTWRHRDSNWDPVETYKRTGKVVLLSSQIVKVLKSHEKKIETFSY